MRQDKSKRRFVHCKLAQMPMAMGRSDGTSRRPCSCASNASTMTNSFVPSKVQHQGRIACLGSQST
eukprot:1714629-Karenia_brevis.AAC.1